MAPRREPGLLVQAIEQIRFLKIRATSPVRTSVEAFTRGVERFQRPIHRSVLDEKRHVARNHHFPLTANLNAILEPHTEHETRCFFLGPSVGITNEQIPRQAPRPGRHVELR